MTRIVLVITLSLTSAGCSFFFAHGPPKNYEAMDYFSCTESNAAPILDVIGAGLSALTAVDAKVNPDHFNNPDAIFAGNVAWTALFSFAAVTGFKKTRECRAARMQLIERMAQDRAQPAGPPVGTGTVDAVVISPASVAVKVGERTQLVAKAHTSSGAEVPGRVYTWSSSNDAVASVNNAGSVTAHAAGRVVIAANTGGVVGTATITVSAP